MLPVRPPAKLALSLAVAAAGSVLVVVFARPSAPGVELVDRARSIELATLSRRADTRPSGASGPGVVALTGEPLDEATARQLFTIGPDQVFDPRAGFRFAPHLEQSFPMDDVPGGAWLRRTNGAGLREDRELFDTRPDVFVLVSGDSHTEGICANGESFANQLEARLAAARPEASVEVLNAGVSAYTFFNELGMLENYASRRPDVFVSAFFSGNDFSEALPLHHYFRRESARGNNTELWRRLAPLRNGATNALGQGLFSLAYFTANPEKIDVAVRAALDVCAQMRAVCEAHGIEWIVVWIPSAFERRESCRRERIDEWLEAAGLARDAVGVETALLDRTIAGLRADGVPIVDLREHFVDDGEPWYWNDLHVNRRAHAKIAEVLEPLVESRIRARAR